MAEGIISRKGGSAFTTNAVTRQASVSQGNTIAPGNIITLSTNAVSSVSYDLPTPTTPAYSRKMVKLSETTAFVLYGQSNNYSANIGAVITQNTNKSITMGTTSSFTYAGGQGVAYGYDLARLNDGRILYVGVEYNTSGFWALVFRFITISGTTVTFSSDILPSQVNNNERPTTNSQLDSVVLEVINDNQVLVHYVNVNSYNTARIFTISGNTITGNTPFLLNTTFGTQYLSIAKIDETKYAVGYQNTTNNYPYVQVLVVSGPAPNYDTVTMGTAYIPVTETIRSTAVTAYTHEGTTRVVFAGWSDSAYRARIFWYDVSGASLNLWTSDTMWGTSNSTYPAYINGNANITLKHLYADRIVVSGLWRDTSNYKNGAVRIYDRNSSTFSSDRLAYSSSSTSNEVQMPYAVYLNQNNIILSLTFYNTSVNSTYRNVFYSIYNTDYLVASNTTSLTSVRGFAITGGTQDQLIDVYTIGVNPT